MAKPKRYDQILRLVEEAKPETILEVGVWNGDRAMAMAHAALKHKSKVHYKGYDLFEEANERTNEEEFNAKPNWTVERVAQRLDQFASLYPEFTFELHKGNSRETLNEQTADFVYIDGGHSVETIRSDYEAVKGSPFIVFDDYYRPDASGACPNLSKVGANEIVNEIEGNQIIDVGDAVMGGGYVCLAVIRNAPVTA